MHQFLERFIPHASTANPMFEKAEKELNIVLPQEYSDFLKLTNGGEGFIGKNAYVMFWSVEDLAQLNRLYEVQKYAPGLFIFGSDGSGEAFGFDMRVLPWSIVQIPFVGMDWSLAQPIGKTFNGFLQRLSET